MYLSGTSHSEIASDNNRRVASRAEVQRARRADEGRPRDKDVVAVSGVVRQVGMARDDVVYWYSMQ